MNFKVGDSVIISHPGPYPDHFKEEIVVITELWPEDLAGDFQYKAAYEKKNLAYNHAFFNDCHLAPSYIIYWKDRLAT